MPLQYGSKKAAEYQKCFNLERYNSCKEDTALQVIKEGIKGL